MCSLSLMGSTDTHTHTDTCRYRYKYASVHLCLCNCFSVNFSVCLCYLRVIYFNQYARECNKQAEYPIMAIAR